MALTCLSIFREVNAINFSDDSAKIILDKVGNLKLEALDDALSGSKSLNRSAYDSWVTHFDIGRGRGSGIEFEAMLSYLLSWSILPSGP